METPSEGQRFRESFPRNPVTTLSPPPALEALVLLLPCQAVATSRISRVRGPMASAGKWQADAGLAGGQRTGFSDTGSDGTRPTGHVFLSTSPGCLSCFPLPPSSWADPTLPLLARQGNHRVWKSWLKKKTKQNKDMTPRGRGWSKGRTTKFGALPKPPLRGPGSRDMPNVRQAADCTHGVSRAAVGSC